MWWESKKKKWVKLRVLNKTLCEHIFGMLEKSSLRLIRPEALIIVSAHSGVDTRQGNQESQGNVRENKNWYEMTR